jgi:outer membrane cobalamin receptor
MEDSIAEVPVASGRELDAAQAEGAEELFRRLGGISDQHVAEDRGVGTEPWVGYRFLAEPVEG